MKGDAVQGRSNKILYLDVLRAWACICVIIIHVCTYYSQSDVRGMDYLISNVFQSMVRSAVPLFVMISGALMLDEEYRCTGEKLKKMIMNRMMFFIGWSLFYTLVFCVLLPMLKGDILSADMILESLMNGHHHLWFIPMLMGLYLILPLLRLWVKKENKRYVEYFLMLCFVFTSVLPFVIEKLSDLFPITSHLGSIVGNMNLQYVGGYTGYFILGWYLNTFPPKNPRRWYVFGILGVLLTFAGTEIFSIYKGEPRNFHSVFSIGIVCYAAASFVWVKSLLGDRTYNQGIFCRTVRLICQCSMGIYAIHPAIIQIIFKVTGVQSAVVMIPLVCFSAFILSWAMTQILRHMPIIKNYLV